MTDEVEQRLRQVLGGPVDAPDADAMLHRVNAGVRRRKQRRVAGAAALAVAVVVGLMTGPAVVDELIRGDEVVAPQPTPPGTSVIPVDHATCCVAVIDDAIWVLHPRERTLQRVDPEDGQAGVPISVPAESMTAVGDKLLLADPDMYQVRLYDPATDESVRITGAQTRGASTFDGESLWLGGWDTGRLTAVRPSDGEIQQQSVIAGVPSYDFMTFSEDGALWATSWEGELMKIDTEEQRVVGRFMPFPDPQDYVAIAAVPGSLFVVSGGQDQLLRLDPRTGELLSQRTITLTANTGFPALFEQPDGSLWLLTGPDHVERLDPGTGEAAESYRVALPTDVAPSEHYNGGLAVGLGSVWVGTWPAPFDASGHLIRLDRR